MLFGKVFRAGGNKQMRIQSYLVMAATQAAPVATLFFAGLLVAQTNNGSRVVGSGKRVLVIQAEDLGMAHSIDKASFAALENGWVTSAGVLVPGPWFPEVVQWSRSHSNADLGVRLDLNSDVSLRFC
jgi:hypothetical protein